jgi:hypothetical protein
MIGPPNYTLDTRVPKAGAERQAATALMLTTRRRGQRIEVRGPEGAPARRREEQHPVAFKTPESLADWHAGSARGR